MNHPAALDDAQLLSQCQVLRQRRRGPGGQHRNKVETAIVLRHTPTAIQATASERRSQHQNHAVALRRLRLQLAVHVRRPCADDKAPSLLWQSRCHGGRLTISDEHRDFPSLLAEALDRLQHCHGEPTRAASQLVCTPSQLVSLIRKHPPALMAVNDQRRERGQSALK